MGYYPVDKVEIRRGGDYSTLTGKMERSLIVRAHYVDMGGPDGKWVEKVVPCQWDRPDEALSAVREFLVELAM